jgi:hypothetical protein
VRARNQNGRAWRSIAAVGANGFALVKELGNAAIVGQQVESVSDEVLPGEVRELPDDLAALDVLSRGSDTLRGAATE